MSPRLVRLLTGGLALAAVGSAALAGEPYFRERQANITPPYPTERWENAAAFLGQKLFFDIRLSRTGTTACASCHHPAYAFAEPRRVSISDTGTRGRRNAPSLINANFLSTLMWDGRFRTLEQQALGPFRRGEMGIGVDEAVHRLNSDPEYVHLFRLSFDRHPTADGMAKALAAYQRTLVSAESRVERFLRTSEPGLLSRLEYDGLHVFDSRAACSTCHRLAPPSSEPWTNAPVLFTDMRFHNLGIGFRGGRFTDPGRFGVSGLDADLGAFRTPSLRNVARTAPYMHDGSLATLEEVVEFYDKGGDANPHLSPLIRKLELTKEEQADLVEFLKALTSPVLPQLEECDTPLAAGRPREAFDAFRAELARRPGDARALAGLARSAVALDDAEALTTAEAALRRRVAELSPGGAKDGEAPVPDLLFWIGRTNQVLSRHDDATAPTRQEDAITALRRARESGAASPECLALHARMLEEVRSPEDALAALDADIAKRPKDASLVALRGDVLYRSVWQQGDGMNDRSREKLRRAAADYESAIAAGGALSDDSLLYRAYAHHRLGDVAKGRAAYADAVVREPTAERALKTGTASRG